MRKFSSWVLLGAVLAVGLGCADKNNPASPDNNENSSPSPTPTVTSTATDCLSCTTTSTPTAAISTPTVCFFCTAISTQIPTFSTASTPSATGTATSTVTGTATSTPTPSVTSVFTTTATPTSTPTFIITVSASQSPTATATLTPLCSAPTPVGYATVGGSSLAGGYMVAMSIPSGPGQVGSMEVYLTGAGQVQGAIYADDGYSFPGTILGQSAVAQAQIGWNTVTFNPPATVTTAFWLAAQSTGNTLPAPYMVYDGSPNESWAYTSANYWSFPLNGTGWTPEYGTSGILLSMYANVCP